MSDISSRVKAIIVDKLGVDENEVVDGASFTNDLGADSLDTVELIMEFEKEFDIQIVDTGENTMTGGRLKRIENEIDDTFCMTYGDGLTNSNIVDSIEFHRKNNFITTLTAVKPPGRFGALYIKDNEILQFKEKIREGESWINGGFFVMEPGIFKFLKNDSTILERQPLENISKLKKLGAYKHYDSWQCMDTIRDKQILENLIKKKIF